MEPVPILLSQKRNGIIKGLDILAESSVEMDSKAIFGGCERDYCGCVHHGGKCDTELF